jgi:hypothetical protein
MSVNEDEDQYLEIGMGSKEEYLKHLDIDHELGKALNYWDVVKGEITANYKDYLEEKRHQERLGMDKQYLQVLNRIANSLEKLTEITP